MAEHDKPSRDEHPVTELLHGVALELGLKTPRPEDFESRDADIREEVCERLWADPEVDVGEVIVTVEHGLVRLEGTVPNRAMKHRIEDVTAACPGVADVENRIRVSRPDRS